ncbi:WD40-repeat-containing domain protein [Mycotypha africana]|uniref:WD40-repeat-containing domain protein n=1 Tax=Mycotypha africana TaxID=64632 RepID=UPI002300B768|nr:WD40-repeat-containing domain protein [Mycotypha africana]KAI8979395.1 WD40-repeat-containing domain protein [Mycotypha africana]
MIFQFVFPDRDLCTPFACDYAHRAMDGNLLAVGDEEGRVSLIRTDKSNERPNLAFHQSFYCHRHVVTDVKWSRDDSMLLTVANDRLARLWDTQTCSILAEFHGHQDFVKSVNWHPIDQHVFVTTAKDGSFRVWDTRYNRKISETTDDASKLIQYEPVKVVENAHIPKDKKPTKKNEKSSHIRSVTSALFLPYDTQKVISSGCTDGTIKLWDIRFGRTASVLESATFISPSGKLIGITDMKLDKAGTRLFCSCMDSNINMFYINNLKEPARQFSDPNFRVGSFDVRISLSPDEEYLLSGSIDSSAYVWQTEHCKEKPYVYEGHQDKVTSVCWNKRTVDQFATCSEDFTTRIWKMEIE